MEVNPKGINHEQINAVTLRNGRHVEQLPKGPKNSKVAVVGGEILYDATNVTKEYRALGGSIGWNFVRPVDANTVSQAEGCSTEVETEPIPANGLGVNPKF